MVELLCVNERLFNALVGVMSTNQQGFGIVFVDVRSVQRVRIAENLDKALGLSSQEVKRKDGETI